MDTTANTARGGEVYSETLLSPEEAALRLRLSAHTLAKWRLNGSGPEWRRIGNKRVYYPLHSLNAFMAKAS